MEFSDIGPLQLVAIGFGPESTFQGLILDEIDRLTARGLIRVLDLRFLAKGSDGDLAVLEYTGLDDDELDEYGQVIDQLMGLADGPDDDLVLVDEAEQVYGLSPAEVLAIADQLPPKSAMAVVLMEHTWASELKASIRGAGGFPLAQGFITPEALFMVGEEVRAMAEAEAAVELAEAISGAAMLDALITVEAAEDIKSVAAAEAVRALIVAGLIVDAAAEEALAALVEAELITEAAIEVAATAAQASSQEVADALDDLLVAEAEG